jgi:glutamyl-tRNA reductase
MVETALRHRRQRDPLFLIDIAVPRDIEPEVGDLPEVFLYNIDDLQQLVEADQTERRQRAAQAEMFVRDAAMTYASQMRVQQSAAPLVSSMRAKMHATSEAELDRLRQRLPHLTASDWKAIEAAFTAVENKMLHDPTVKIREYAAESDAETSAVKMSTVRELFGLAGMEKEPTISPSVYREKHREGQEERS